MFECWDGSEDVPWAEEAENYIRASLLRHARHVLALRDELGELVGVSAFDERNILLPINTRTATIHPSWHLQVVAVRVDLQGQRLVDEIFELTFDAMRQADTERIIVTARVHRKNLPSLKACARHSIDPLREVDDHYLELLGEVPPE